MYHSRMLQAAKRDGNLNEFVYLAKEISRMLKEQVSACARLVDEAYRCDWLLLPFRRYGKGIGCYPSTIRTLRPCLPRMVKRCEYLLSHIRTVTRVLLRALYSALYCIIIISGTVDYYHSLFAIRSNFYR